jgi:hypothetical protein
VSEQQQQPLTEQLSLRLSIGQRDYLRREMARLRREIPPVQVSEADVVRMLIDGAVQREWALSQDVHAGRTP